MSTPERQEEIIIPSENIRNVAPYLVGTGLNTLQVNNIAEDVRTIVNGYRDEDGSLVAGNVYNACQVLQNVVLPNGQRIHVINPFGAPIIR